MASPHYDLKQGMTLGRNYFVVEFLGSGWEGEVYKVVERRSGIQRAAKIFYENRRPSKKRMQSYIKKLHRLRHCPIITQYPHRDIARVGRESVEILISDLAEGEILSSFLRKQPKKRLPAFEALHLLCALAVGMEPVHFAGDYHGDIHSENVVVKRIGLGFNVRLLDFFDLGRPSREKIQYDVFDLVRLLHESIGGPKEYSRSGPEIRHFVCGLKRSLISRKFKTAGQLRTALNSMTW
jgi:hypothetical protein